MQRRFSLVVAGLIILAPVAGCGPSVSEKQLGEIQYEVPQFSGEKSADKSSNEAGKPTASPPANEPATDVPRTPPK